MIRKLWRTVGTAIAILMASPLIAMAQEGAAPAGGSHGSGLIGLGIGLGLGIAAMGCGLGQGRLGASAMESIGRNPNSTNQLFVPMIIGLAFIESLTLYSLVVSFILMGKI
ncbi:MAG: ATP synthase F0 subunit C [Candidatus Binataceae bacterium]